MGRFGECTLERLHQGRHDGILHEHGDGAGAANVLGRDRRSVLRAADHHAAESLAHVGERGRERQDGHDLGRDGNVERGLARHKVLGLGVADRDATQESIVGVDHSVERDGRRVDVQSNQTYESARTDTQTPTRSYTRVCERERQLRLVCRRCCDVVVVVVVREISSGVSSSAVAF